MLLYYLPRFSFFPNCEDKNWRELQEYDSEQISELGISCAFNLIQSCGPAKCPPMSLELHHLTHKPATS